MKYIKLYEDIDFDPNNFRKLKKDIKAITVELKDDKIKTLAFEVEKDKFDTFDFFIRMYRKQTSMNKWGFKIEEVQEYINTIKEYIDEYYNYNILLVYYNGSKLIPKSDDRITQVEIEIGDIKKK